MNSGESAALDCYWYFHLEAILCRSLDKVLTRRQCHSARRLFIVPGRIVYLGDRLPVCIIHAVIGVLALDGISAALVLIVAFLFQGGEDL